jgi:hypothetical protein
LQNVFRKFGEFSWEWKTPTISKTCKFCKFW